MGKIKQLINLFFTKKIISKFIAYWLLLLFFYLFKDFWGIFLLIFIFSYLFLSSSEFLKLQLDKFLLFNIKDKKRLKLLKNFFGLNFIIILLYLIFIWIVVFILSSIIPKLTWELQSFEKIVWWAHNIQGQLNTFVLDLNTKYNINLSEYLQKFYQTVDIGHIINNITWYLRWAWKWFIYILFSLVLSLIFILDRNKLQQYLFWIKNSSYWFLYKEYKIIFNKILKSFWLILKAQSLIAIANSTFTVIWLLVIWFFYHNAIWGYIFPYILTLWLIVFIAWFIPILGTFISGTFILLIAYLTIGWWSIIITIILLILIIHLIEAYYLNPKIVSNFLEMPVSLTFIILLVSEHLFWIAWLIIWVSLFYFVVWLFRDLDKLFKKKKKKLEEINKWFKKKAI